MRNLRLNCDDYNANVPLNIDSYVFDITLKIK